MEGGVSAVTIGAGDSLVIEVPVAFDVGSTVTSLAGAAVVASAARKNLAGAVVETVAGATSISGDTVTCTWAAGALAAGNWRLRVVVTKSSQTQTVLEELVTVRP